MNNDVPVIDARAIAESEGAVWEQLTADEREDALVRVWDEHAPGGEGTVDLAALGLEKAGTAPSSFRWLKITRQDDDGRQRVLAMFYLVEKAGELHDVYLTVRRKGKPPNPFLVGTWPLRLDKARMWGDEEGKLPESIFGDPEGWGKDFQREVNEDPLAPSRHLGRAGYVRGDEVVTLRDPHSPAHMVKVGRGESAQVVSGVKLGTILHRYRVRVGRAITLDHLLLLIHGGGHRA